MHYEKITNYLNKKSKVKKKWREKKNTKMITMYSKMAKALVTKSKILLLTAVVVKKSNACQSQSKKATSVPKSSIRKQAGRIRYFSVSPATSNSVNFATYLTMWEHMQVRDRMLVNTATKRSHSEAIAIGIWTRKSAWTVPRQETILREVQATDTHI